MDQKTQLAAIRQWLPGSDLSPVVFPVSRTLRTLFADMDNRKTDQQHNTRCFPDEQPPGPPPRSRPNFDGVRTSEGQKPHCGQAGHEPTAFSGLKRSIREAGSNDAHRTTSIALNASAKFIAGLLACSLFELDEVV